LERMAKQGGKIGPATELVSVYIIVRS